MSCGPSYCGAMRAACYDLTKFAVRADCGPSYCGAGCGPGDDQYGGGGGGCGVNCNLRGRLRDHNSGPHRALVLCTMHTFHTFIFEINPNPSTHLNILRVLSNILILCNIIHVCNAHVVTRYPRLFPYVIYFDVCI